MASSTRSGAHRHSRKFGLKLQFFPEHMYPAEAEVTFADVARTFEQLFMPRLQVSCAVPCCAMLCHTVPCCATLCHAVPRCAMLCHAVPCCPTLCHAVPCCAMLSYAVPCCALLCHPVPCCALLCHPVPCCAMMCYAVPHCADIDILAPIFEVVTECTVPSKQQAQMCLMLAVHHINSTSLYTHVILCMRYTASIRHMPAPAAQTGSCVYVQPYSPLCHGSHCHMLQRVQQCPFGSLHYAVLLPCAYSCNSLMHSGANTHASYSYDSCLRVPLKVPLD